VVRSHRRDIDALRQAAAELLSELRAPTQRDKDGVLVVVPLIHRSRVIADLSSAMARLVPLERQAFGLDEDRPHGSQPMTVVWEGMPAGIRLMAAKLRAPPSAHGFAKAWFARFAQT
jgi:hypothetical protein